MQNQLLQNLQYLLQARHSQQQAVVPKAACSAATLECTADGPALAAQLSASEAIRVMILCLIFMQYFLYL